MQLSLATRPQSRGDAMRHFIIAIAFVLALPSLCLALGGQGATCNPSLPGWSTCTKEEPSWAASASTVINVPGGTFTVPYSMTTANRRYVLQGDVEADGQAFLFKADYCILDLNGYTVTYGKTKKGSGVAPGSSNRRNLAILNGSIIQSLQSVGAVVSATINDGGTGYIIGDVLTLSGWNVITPATFEVTGVSGGVVTSIALLTPGLGHDVHQPSLSTTVPHRIYDTTGGAGTGARITVTATVTEGDELGVGPGPISRWSGEDSGSRAVLNDFFVGQVYTRYGGRDLTGILVSGDYPIITQSIAEDTYEFGTLKNRQAGFGAIRLSTNPAYSQYGIVKNSTVINARHRGIDGANDSEIYGNHVTTRTIATNASGISPGYQVRNCKVYNNTIIGRGEHPIGIGVGGGTGSDGVEAYNNLIDLQVTALGEEYGGSYINDPSATYTGNSASGFRLTWNSFNTLVHDNSITIQTSSRYTGTYSPTGAVAYIKSSGKGLFIGLEPADTTAEAHFYNNTISVTGSGDAYGVTCSYNFSDKMFVYNNTIASSQYNIVIGDSYGACNGFPLFWNNTLVKSDDRADYRTIIGTYNEINRNNQARLVDTIYSGGASESSITLQPASSGITDIYFGSVVNGIHLYGYRLHDAANTSSTLLREDFDPPVPLSYSYPVLLPPGTLYPTSFRIPGGAPYGIVQ